MLLFLRDHYSPISFRKTTMIFEKQLFAKDEKV